MGIQTGACRRPAGAAFTLIELLLTVTLLLLMAAAAVVNFDSFQRGSQLDEGATLMESLFRYARAQSASTGRTLRLVFDEEVGRNAGGTNVNVATAHGEGMQVVWESDPLNAPGRFELLREAAPFTDRLNELLEVRRVRSPQESAGTATTVTNLSFTATPSRSVGTNDVDGADDGAGGPGNGRMPIVFYPDGSSDSVEVLLVSRAGDDRRLMVLTLSGMIGTTRRRWLSVDDSGRTETEGESVKKPGEVRP